MFPIIKYFVSYLRNFSFRRTFRRRRYIYTLYYFSLDKEGYLDFKKRTRLWSWHRDYKSATRFLERCGDFERYYSHALIEKVPEDFGFAEVISCFHCTNYHTNEFEEIELPKSFRHTFNFTIG